MSFLPYLMYQLSTGREYLDVVKVKICNEDIPCCVQTEEHHHTLCAPSDTQA